MDNPIVERILREAGAPDLLETLTQRLEPSDLQSLLLAVYRKRAKALSPAALSKLYVRFAFDQARESGRGYYTGAEFRIAARDLSGAEYGLVDGGLTDWTQQLLSNRKERLLVSGAGSERLVAVFG